MKIGYGFSSQVIGSKFNICMCAKFHTKSLFFFFPENDLNVEMS